MTPEAERFNGWAAMLGFVAAIGAYVTTGQIIPGWIQVLVTQVAKSGGLRNIYSLKTLFHIEKNLHLELLRLIVNYRPHTFI